RRVRVRCSGLPMSAPWGPCPARDLETTVEFAGGRDCLRWHGEERFLARPASDVSRPRGEELDQGGTLAGAQLPPGFRERARRGHVPRGHAAVYRWPRPARALHQRGGTPEYGNVEAASGGRRGGGAYHRSRQGRRQTYLRQADRRVLLRHQA